MQRILFNTYFIDDQNHDFLTSKKHFSEALHEHLMSGSFEKNFAKTESISKIAKNSKSLVIIRCEEEDFANSRVSHNVTVLYIPQITGMPIAYELKMYEVDLLKTINNSSLHYGIDEIPFALTRFLKRKKINFDMEHTYTIGNIILGIPVRHDKSNLSIMVEGEGVVDMLWEIINLLEQEFFRQVEKSDFLNLTRP